MQFLPDIAENSLRISQIGFIGMLGRFPVPGFPFRIHGMRMTCRQIFKGFHKTGINFALANKGAHYRIAAVKQRRSLFQTFTSVFRIGISAQRRE